MSGFGFRALKNWMRFAAKASSSAFPDLSGNAEELAFAAKRIQFFNALNPKPLIDLLCGFRTHARHRHQLEQPERHVLFELFVERNCSGGGEFGDFVGQILTDAGDFANRSPRYHRFDVAGQTFQVCRGAPVRTHSERIGTLDFEKVRNSTENGGDFEISHQSYRKLICN